MGHIILNLVVWMLGICCQLPHVGEVGPSRNETAGSDALAWIWACFAAGVVFLSLSLATAVWIAVRFA